MNTKFVIQLIFLLNLFLIVYSKCQIIKVKPPPEESWFDPLSSTIFKPEYLQCKWTNLKQIYINVLERDGQETIVRVTNSKISELYKLNFTEILNKIVDCPCSKIKNMNCDSLIKSLYQETQQTTNKPSGTSGIKETTTQHLDTSIPEMLDEDYKSSTQYIKNVSETYTEEPQFIEELKQLKEEGYSKCTTCKELCINYWKNVTELHLNNVGVKVLRKEFFDGFYELNQLDLSHNNISSIEENIFTNLFNLETLDLSFNQLKEIKSNHFQGLRNMRWLYLKHNHISQMPSNFFGGYMLVTVDIDLSFNKLTKIETEFDLTLSIRLNNNQIKGEFNFSKFPKDMLQYLDISNNQIDTLINLNDVAIYSVNVSHNKVENIYKTGTIKKLDLSFNSFKNINDIKITHYLQFLNLSHNNITEIPANAFGSNFLEKLSLSHNRISVLHSNCFKKLSSYLRDLDLSYNALTFNSKNKSYPLDVFSTIKVLNLDLSENNLKVDWNIFLRLKHVKNLNLTGNDIPFVDPDVLRKNLRFLQTITIDRTMWLCEELDKFVLGLRKYKVKVVEGIARYICTEDKRFFL